MGTTSSRVEHSRTALAVTVTAATIGVIYGYDTGVIAGALLFIPKEFNLSTSETSSIATAVALGMIVGALAAGRVADRIGRRVTMIAIAAGYVVFAALSAFAQNLAWLDGARFLLGVTIGLSLVVAPVFIAESSPAAIRGSLLVSYQVATVAGIMLAYFVSYALASSGEWRWMLGVSAFPAAVVGLLVFRLPDSPRWYVMKDRRHEARETLRRVDPDADLESELTKIDEALAAERGGRISDMARKPYARATIFVVALGFLVQITGINAIVYFTPLIFQKVGLTGNVALLLVPGLIQLTALFATLAALRLVDRIGRRLVLLIGIGSMMVANALMIIVFAIGLSGGVKWLAFLGVLLFTCGFDFGFGAMVWVYASESFPGRLRSAGASAMLSADLIGNLLIAQFFLGVLGSIGGVATFSMFLVLAAVSFVFVFVLAPETRGRPLEAIRLYWENGGHWPDPAGGDSGSTETVGRPATSDRPRSGRS